MEWEAEKVKCFLSEEERKDNLLLLNLMHGSIVTAKMYPLLFDKADREAACYFRSFSFFEEVVADRSHYDILSEDNKLIFAVGLRDLFFAASASLLTQREQALLKSLVDLVDDSTSVTTFEAQGLALSFHPSKDCKVLKFVERSSFEDIDVDWHSYFADAGGHQGKEEGLSLCAVFVDLAELSFHNFENIVHLDRWFERKLKDKQNDLQLSMTDLVNASEM